jgi:hypothetical protein
MSLLARFRAIALVLILGQYMLAGSGYGCRDAAHSGRGVTEATLAVRAAPEAHSDCDSESGSPCSLYDMVCGSMAVCGPLVMSVDRSEPAPGTRLTSDRILLALADAPSRSVAPEPPPPRA